MIWHIKINEKSLAWLFCMTLVVATKEPTGSEKQYTCQNINLSIKITALRNEQTK
jgi:hypothetical protein